MKYLVEKTSGGFTVTCDGEIYQTPARKPLIVPTQALAETIVAEKPPSAKPVKSGGMPILQIALTAIDIIAPDRGKTVDRIVAYAKSELLCHRAGEPPALVNEQDKVWQPLLDWCARRFEAPLKTGHGIMPIAQPYESIAALRDVITQNDEFQLAGLDQAVSVSGSLVLGLALQQRHLAADHVCDAAELDALYQMKEWGADPDAQARIEGMRQELRLLERWFTLLDFNRM